MKDNLTSPEKLERLKGMLGEMESVLIAYSGGADSTFLVRIARDVLGDRVLAVTATSPTYPTHELEAARRTAAELGVKHSVIVTEETSDPRFAANPPERCYWCKKGLFSELAVMARDLGLNHVLDGSNFDDADDFRPGMKAAEECGVRSLLKEVGITKPEIREYSKLLGLPTWDSPSSACLASRFPYGTRITAKGLNTIELAEGFLRKAGLNQVRVRHHGTIARIEAAEGDAPKLLSGTLRSEISKYFKQLGYTYVTIDLDGYRTGSMNEVLSGG